MSLHAQLQERQAEGRPRFLAVYELEDPAVLDNPAFLEAGRPTSRRTALGDHFRAQLQVYRQVFPEVGAFIHSPFFSRPQVPFTVFGRVGSP